MKNLLLPILCTLFLSACSPHPGTGKWKADGENSLGIAKLTVAYEGKAVFTSTKPDPAVWHCFWNAAEKQTVNLACTPSTDTEAEQHFVFSVQDDGIAELSRNGQRIGLFIRIEGNPAIQ